MASALRANARRRGAVALAAVALIIPLGGCGGDDGEEEGSTQVQGVELTANCTDEAGAADVDVELLDYALRPDPVEVPAGDTAIRATNTGAQFHEVVVVRGTWNDMTTKDDGSLDEDALPDGAVIGEIEGPDRGGTCSDTFALEAGEYLLVCNVTNTVKDPATGEDRPDSHFARGMFAPLTVE